jgi:hypothetical protein
MLFFSLFGSALRISVQLVWKSFSGKTTHENDVRAFRAKYVLLIAIHETHY